MSTSFLQFRSVFRGEVVQLVAGWWVEPWPRPRAARGLVVPLRRSPLARRLLYMFVSCQLLCVLELAWIGHWSAVTALLTVAACSSWMFVRDARALAGAPNRLLLTADGRLFALTPGGQVLPQRLHPSTRHLGRWLYLRLHDKAGMHAWLLGPDNLDPATLASLRRRIGSMANRDFD